MTQSEESITLVTSYRLPHHDSRSFTFVQPDILPFPVIQSFGKNTLRERWKPAMCHKAKNLLPWWRLTVFLTTAADPSRSFSLTFYRSQSFRALARIPCEKGGNQQCVIKRRIYYLEWHLTVFLTTTADSSHSFRMTFYRLIQGSWTRPPEGARWHT